MKGKIIKRTAALALSLLIVGGSIPQGSDFSGLFSRLTISANAADVVASGTCGDNATWSLDDEGKLTISGTGAMADYGDTIQPWKDYKSNITSVEIADGITSIGNSAFYGCENLSSVNIPDSVTSIGNNAFRSCYSLTSVTIPEGVTTIEYDAFYKCTGITDVYCYANPDDLTWTDGGCDDFIRKPAKKTKCHVPANYLADYNTKFNTGNNNKDVNVTFVGDLPVTCGDRAYWSLTDTDDDGTADKLTITGTGAMYDYNWNTIP